MARQWTPEERRKQAEAVKRWKPWEKSTGPKTRAGKQRTKYNAYKDGVYTPEWAALRRALCLNREFVKNAAAFASAGQTLKLRKRTIKNP